MKDECDHLRPVIVNPKDERRKTTNPSLYGLINYLSKANNSNRHFNL